MQPRTSPLIALRYRNYRLLWISLLISMSGSMMQNAAILWHVSLVVPEDQKALALGLVGLVRIAPIIVFSLMAGVVADALDRRKLMLLTQVGLTLVAALLALVAFSGVQAVWPIYVLAAVGAAIGSFDGPARQSLFPTLVPREHLPNAISLNSIIWQTASVVGPMLGGLIIASFGVGWAFALNAVSFFAVIAALLMMRDLPQRVESEKSEISLSAALDGLRFVFSHPLIRSTMLLDFCATFFASATALLPIFAQDILRVDARGYGLLASAPAIGAMATSIVMVPLVQRLEQRGKVLIGSVVAYGLTTVVFGISTWFWLTFACLVFVGASDMVSTVIRNIIRQLITPDHLRGRMTSVNMVFFMGGPQLGELEAGLVAQAWGAPFSVISGGLGCLLVTLAIAWQTPALRAYRRDEPQLAAQAAD
jgi:MFS family permease